MEPIEHPEPATAIPSGSVTASARPPVVAAPADSQAPIHPPPAALPPRQAIESAWPRSAQLTTAFLLGLATALLLSHVLGQVRWGARPTELTYRVDLNEAGHAELLQLPGVGETLAGRIEDYRHEHGRFRNVDELTNVHGIGPATLERLRPCVFVRPEEKVDDLQPVRLARKPTRAPPEHAADAGMGGRGPRPPGKKEASLTQPIDLNRAGLDELQRLPGIGKTRAQQIVDERSRGPFKSLDDLRHRVKGIGPKTVERLRPYVTVGKEPARVAAVD
jgi:competence ComEA-like helix-hairpin-helix protein